MMRAARASVLFLLVLVAACQPLAPQHPTDADAGLSERFSVALMREASDPLAAEDYLDLLDASLERADHPMALATTLAVVEALVWRNVGYMPLGLDHAMAYRSRTLLTRVTARLRRAFASGKGSPFQRALIADALQDLALRVGAAKAAAKWRRRMGCVPVASVVGPIAWPPLAALEQPSPLEAAAPLPKELDGLQPFAAKQPFEPVYANACYIDVNEASALRGLRLVVVDVEVPEPQRIAVALTASAAVKVELGGKLLLERRYAAGAGATLRLAFAEVQAGWVRLVARVAQNNDGNQVRLQVLDAAGKPLRTRAPRAGESAPAKVDRVAPEPVAAKLEQARDLPLVAAALLAAGESRRAEALFEDPLAPPLKQASTAMDLVRLRALMAGRSLPQTQLLSKVESTATRVREACPACWEATLAAAAVAKERKGFGTGLYAAFELLGVHSDELSWTDELALPLLVFVAQQAAGAGLSDVARHAYDAVARRVPEAPLLADLDWALYQRNGSELVQAACAGGTSRATTRCLFAQIGRSDLTATLNEMARLRQLRGDPALHRDLEIRQLLAFGQAEDALAIYDAMSPGRRQLALLGEALGSKREADAKRRLLRDMERARDTPYALEPLARLLGAVPDRTAELEKRSAELVRRDRQKAFLPGAATAVLSHEERYRLQADGLLSFWLYDLRRVSGTADVAGGTFSGAPMVEGRMAYDQVRKRIYKKDGRVLDPDPSAGGRQMATELSQLEAGDYVEAISVGFGLPDDSGQLVVDTPDVLPLRTSVRQGIISLERPAALTMDLWAHALLGKGASTRHAGMVTTSWKLTNQSPRRIEEGVPPLESRVAISFGTDSYARIARALADRFEGLDENDPYVALWLNEVLGKEQLEPDKKVAKVVAEIGKVVRRGDAYALSDAAASFAGGPQRETARMILERGTGSRTWVVHRALRELGIASEIAVAETRPFSSAEGFPPHTGRFTQPLVRAEVGGKTLWIDADVEGPPLPPGRVSPELRGRKALLASGEMVTVDAESVADVDEIDIRVVVDGKGDAKGTFTALLHGQAAQGLAQAFEVVVGSDRDQLLRSVVLGWLPWANVSKVTLSSDEGAWQVAVRADVTLVGFARPEDRKGRIWSLPGMTVVHNVFPRAHATTLGARYAAQSGRTTALAIDEPLLYHVHRRVELPSEAKVTHLAAGVKVQSPELNAERVIGQQGAVLEEDYRLNLPVGTVAPDAFDSFVERVRTVDDGFMHSTRVELSAK